MSCGSCQIILINYTTIIIIKKEIFINMSNRIVPITRLGKFFGAEDYNLDISMGREWLEGDMNFTLVLYRVDKQKTNVDDVYGEASVDGVKFLPPVEFKAFLQIVAPENKFLGTSKINQMEPGNARISVYQKHLDELEIDIEYGDYIGYYETESRVRYYVVNNDGRVVSDNKHTYAGYKPFYRTINASPVTENEFRGL
jgi:hypothetical protein